MSAMRDKPLKTRKLKVKDGRPKHVGTLRLELGSHDTENVTTISGKKSTQSRIPVRVSKYKQPRTPLTHVQPSTTPPSHHSECTLLRHKPNKSTQDTVKATLVPPSFTPLPGALGTRAIEQGYSIPVRSRICSHPKVALHSSHKRGIQKKEIDVLFERMALSTAKKLSRLRPRIAEDPVVVDTVKLNLETKLSEASESCNSRPERSNHNRIKALVTLELSPNFYELEEELINIKWGHSQGNVSESDVRCKQPVACMLEQHYFVPVLSNDSRYKIVNQ